jgi:uncharacterized protein (DUF2141 family)
MCAKFTIIRFVFAFFFALLAPSRSLHTSAAPASQPDAKLTVRVVGLRNHKGQLIFGVFDQPDGFPNVEGKSKNWQVKSIDADSVTFTCELPPGRYGASVLHDENKNNQMDKNGVGIPTEGYGVTNNPKPKLRAATFKEALFTLPPEGATLTISVQYF